MYIKVVSLWEAGMVSWNQCVASQDLTYISRCVSSEQKSVNWMQMGSCCSTLCFQRLVIDQHWQSKPCQRDLKWPGKLYTTGPHMGCKSSLHPDIRLLGSIISNSCSDFWSLLIYLSSILLSQEILYYCLTPAIFRMVLAVFRNWDKPQPVPINNCLPTSLSFLFLKWT